MALKNTHATGPVTVSTTSQTWGATVKTTLPKYVSVEDLKSAVQPKHATKK